jgi:hypothetical protein
VKKEQLEAAFKVIREMHSKPIATRMKVGADAWPKVRSRIGGSVEADQQIFANPLGSLLGIPIRVITEPNAWPPNLVAIIDQRGNAMQAWIVND